MNAEIAAVLDLLSMLVLEPRSGLLIGLLLLAAWRDCATGRIPNGLVLIGALLGLAASAWAPQYNMSAGAAFLYSLAGLACGLAALLPFYLLRAMGAGDVKLMAMSGAFLGYPQIVWGVLASFLAGGLLSLAYLLWKGVLRRTVRNMLAMLQGAAYGAGFVGPDTQTTAGTLPYGIAIAGGTIAYLVLHQLGLVQ